MHGSSRPNSHGAPCHFDGWVHIAIRSLSLCVALSSSPPGKETDRLIRGLSRACASDREPQIRYAGLFLCFQCTTPLVCRLLNSFSKSAARRAVSTLALMYRYVVLGCVCPNTRPTSDKGI